MENKLSVILPVYNEAKTFPVLMERLLGKKIEGMSKEIVIVESNSTDGTREEVEKFKDREGVKIIYEDKPSGKGHAVRTGLKAATGTIILIQDGDLEYDINDYDKLVREITVNNRDFVLGSRHMSGWRMRKFDKQPVISDIVNLGHLLFTFLINLFCGTNVKDPFTMYKVFKTSCIENLNLTSNRFDFDWELFIKLTRRGYKPFEIGVNYESRSFKEGKKVRFFYDPFTWIVALLRYRFEKL
jgi:glycosyltransferase involved in cell wall biosynthesis